jgi:hypothetical protein
MAESGTFKEKYGKSTPVKREFRQKIQYNMDMRSNGISLSKSSAFKKVDNLRKKSFGGSRRGKYLPEIWTI